MSWFANLGTAARLLLGFGVIVLLLVVAVLAGYRGMERVRHQSEIATAVRAFESNVHETRAIVMTMVSGGAGADAATLRADIATNVQQNEELLRRLGVLTQDDPELAEAMAEIVRLREHHKQVREEQVSAPLARGDVAAAREAALGPQMQTYAQLRRGLDVLGRQARQGAERTAREASQTLAVTATGALVAALIIVVLLTRLTAPPLSQLATAADRIAGGDLDIVLPDGARRDEIGTLADAFARMARALREMAQAAGRIAAQDLTVQVQPRSAADQLGNAFATMTGTLRAATSTLSESVNTLAASASEILAATTQVASGAAETGTAIAQTTTTVEEVKQTAQLASQKARHVADGAQQAAQVAQDGQRAVQATIEGMRHIQAQMESIAQTVVRLAEQGQSIGEIIATVGDLAEQSNLLAVNAAIEAAKAGEHGKGFAVVAQEVRSLADQSRQATAQVRAILHDVQKATTAAVLATEQGSKAVEGGMKQSTDAGESIARLAGTINEAAQAATQIAASSQQQLVGTDQVALAMQSIKQASMQNVAATRQAESAAHNLNEIGRSIKAIVGQYRL